MSDSTGKSSADSPLKKGFCAYWWRVIKRSFMDTTSLLGSKPNQAAIRLAILIVAALVLSVVFGRDAWDKVIWAALTLVIAIALFLVCMFVFLLRTPWKFEDQAANERAAEHAIILAKMDDLGQLIKQEQQKAAAQFAELTNENKRLASLNVRGNILKHQIGKFIERYKQIVAMLRDFKEAGIAHLTQIDDECKEYLANNVKEFHDFFARHDQVYLIVTAADDEDETPLASEVARQHLEICDDRLQRLSGLLGLIS